MEGFPSGQREQTVNLPSQTSVVRIHPLPPARMAELADALVSGTSEDTFMQVQVLFLAPYRVFITNLRVGCGHSISFTYICVSLICMSRKLILLFFVMPVKHLEHTLQQRLFGFPPGNCAVLQDSAVPDTPQTCSESLSVVCGFCRCL